VSDERPTHPRRGDLLALGSALLGAFFLLAFRESNAQAPRAAAVLALLGWSSIFNGAVALTQARGQIRRPKPATIRAALVLGVLTIIGNLGVAGALQHVDPGLTATVMQTQIFVVGIGGWLLLGERLTGRFFVGAAFALAGFALLGGLHSGVASVSAIGLAFAATASLSFGAMLLYTRKVIREIDPVRVNVLRLVLAVLVMSAWLVPQGVLAELTPAAWLTTAIAAFCGPFVARLCLMFATRHISAARVKLITLLSPVFAFALEIAWLGELPTGTEVAGAGLILAGVLLPIAAARARRPPS